MRKGSFFILVPLFVFEMKAVEEQEEEEKNWKIDKGNFYTHSGSTFAVASSNIRILFFLNIARAKQSNCLWRYVHTYMSVKYEMLGFENNVFELKNENVLKRQERCLYPF